MSKHSGKIGLYLLLIVALIAAYKEKSLLTVALFACAAVFIVERILEFAV